MIARVLIYLPFKILIHKEEHFPIYSVTDSDYVIEFYPPGRDSNAVFEPEPKIIKMDDKEAFYANFIQIDFIKDKFNLSSHDVFDPPLDKINRVLNSFLIRLKHTTQSPQIHPLQIDSYRLCITYINETGKSDEKVDENIVGKCKERVEFNFVALNKDLWDDTFSNRSNLTSQRWTNLLLDANDELPNIGSAVVLAFTALEIFISEILDQLSSKNVPTDLWTWINSRQKEPKTVEQYDLLLKIFTGHTLKDEPKLWDAFNHLKSARDTFVHGGVARITRKSDELEIDEARKLIQQADEITLRIREWLPKEFQWELPRKYHPRIEATVEFRIVAR